MLVRLIHSRTEQLLPFAQFALIGLALHNDSGKGSIVALVLLGLSALYGWTRAVRHARLIADTPTSRIASAAQGYLELRGRALPLDSGPLYSPVDGLPVLWYRLRTEERQRNGQWRFLHNQESDASFLLDDGSGVCAVDPEGAEMLVRRRDISIRGERRYTQWALLRGDPIYVIGEFSTLGSIQPDLDTHAQVGQLLSAWKADPARLLERFDLDGNGELDLREWELARRAARREVLRMQQKILNAPEAHVMRRSLQRQLYLISDLDPQRIGRRYHLLAAFHAAVLLGSLGTAAWFTQIGVF